MVSERGSDTILGAEGAGVRVHPDPALLAGEGHP